MRMSGSKSWSCKACSFYHQFPGPRCAMCGNLQGATRQEMRDFVAGKFLKKDETKRNEGDAQVVEILNGDDEVEDEIMIVGEHPANPLKKHVGTPSTTTTMTKIGNDPPRISNSNKENEGTNNFLTATTNPERLVPVQRAAAINPYLKKRNQIHAQHTSNQSTRQSDIAAHEVNRTVTAPTDLPNGDPWHAASTVSAHARAINPPAPDRQSPVVHNQHTTTEIDNAATSKKKTFTQTICNNTPSHCQRPQQQRFQQQQQQQLKQLKGMPKSPFLKPAKYIPGPIAFDPKTVHDWIYPKSPIYAVRQYQQEIAETAIQHNTLVSLPTGLGKTLIAAVVMYNYWRWFPEGKIVFLAPTLPLVNQQVQACYKIMGLPASDTAVLTGKLSREKRTEHWHSRRVFYCTPQTLQNDLVETTNDGAEVPSSFAERIVCLVLDEAHKATGDYAYVKVIELLEAAGAKFRIVGLSATPGTSINAIQSVINALRIFRVEARDEDDSTVKPYLHQKHVEIVKVPKNLAQTQVERQLTNMLSPILEQLREHRAINFHGNAAVTPFQIINSRNIFTKRNGPPPGHLLTLYTAAHKLISIRLDARQSLVVVRSKLLRLSNEPQRGIMSRVVKSNDFKELVEMVGDATGAGGGLSQQQGGFSRNNPKLTKLSEILIEHFKRASAVGKSSRVIIFAQFRDSVAEIVLLLRTLEPLIRPHHFVGQGKPPKGVKSKIQEGGAEADLIRLNGMKQSEQQQVIQDFRHDKYNVLVCTCIGEEGLDIGEVDLIVNFDILKSPIRSIQRMGRTGRAREGRVISLVAEGEEERSLAQSNANGNKLRNALKTKRNLVMCPDQRLFPCGPQKRREMVMSIGSQLHLSQVAGINEIANRKTKKDKTMSCKLDAAQEQERQQRLGELTTLDTNEIPWRTIRRVIVRHRSQHQTYGGRSSRILKAIESFGPVYDSANSGRTILRCNTALHSIFPTEEPTIEKIACNIAAKAPTQVHPIDSASKKTLTASLMPAVESLHVIGHATSLGNKTTNGHDKIDKSTLKDSPRMEETDVKTISNPLQHVSDTLEEQVKLFHSSKINAEPVFRLPTPPPLSSDDESEDLRSRPDPVVTETMSIHQSLPSAHKKSKIDLPLSFQPVAGMGKKDRNESKNFLFCLPTQSSSSSEGENDDSDTEDSIQSKQHAADDLQVKQGKNNEGTDVEGIVANTPISNGVRNLKDYSAESDIEDDIPLISLRTPKPRQNVSLFSSKESEGCKNEQGDSPIISLRESFASDGSPGFSSNATSSINSKVDRSSTTDEQVHDNVCQIMAVETKNKKRIYIPEESSPNSQFFSLSHASQQRSQQIAEGTPHRDTVRYSCSILQDTPNSPLDVRGVSKTNCDKDIDELIDTPQAAKEKIAKKKLSSLAEKSCQICFSTESLDDNPIVLCDGCDIGLHRHCYPIEVDMASSEDWYCDQCKWQRSGYNSGQACKFCGNSEGHLRRNDDGSYHPLCLAFSSSPSLTCRTCLSCIKEGAVRCFSCVNSMHPFCAINVSSEKPWTVAIVKSQKSENEKVSALFCPEHTENANIFLSMHLKEDGNINLPHVSLIQNHNKSVVSKGKRLRRLKRKRVAPQAHSHSITSLFSQEKKKRVQAEAVRRQLRGRSVFVLEEAEIRSGDDSEGDEEEELKLIEDCEMSQDSFINDAVELTQHFSQDNLHGVDPDACSPGDFHHRAIDAKRYQAEQYKTPVLNRRMAQPIDSPFSSLSQRGLGKMNFVRSILEHQRQGGRAEEIEEYYNYLEQNGNHDMSESSG